MECNTFLAMQYAPVLCTVNCCSVAPLSAILGLGVNFIDFTINDLIIKCDLSRLTAHSLAC